MPTKVDGRVSEVHADSLELDDGQVVALNGGDIIVQKGTRHAWRNGGSKPATVIFVLIGADRSNA